MDALLIVAAVIGPMGTTMEDQVLGESAAAAPAARPNELDARANSQIAARLEEVADVLEQQAANPYRVSAYRQAARTVRDCDQPMDRLVQERGISGLLELPGIGERLARSIYQLATTGHLPMLDRLRGESDPTALFASILGIGRRTAQRIHQQLGIHTLEELEMAAHDGRLERLGIGTKRLAGIRDTLAGRLGYIGRRRAPATMPLPDIEEVLDVDRQYREEAARGTLPRVAPRRFNPHHEPWLSILHTRRGDHDYTALYSNTARAHELDRTHDWVVLYYDGHAVPERQCTVVTARRGPMRGRRIVRGRETECLLYYARHAATLTRSDAPRSVTS